MKNIVNCKMIIQADENFDAILRETFSFFELGVQINEIPLIFFFAIISRLIFR